MSKISVIMPVYNMAEYLDQALDSWTSQTFADIEIICVDDASTDASYDVLMRRAQEDSRILCHRFAENKTAWVARKWGILHATGEYILFADADDTIDPKACEELYAEMVRKPVDILHFGTNIINVNNLPEARITNMQNFIAPHKGTLKGAEIFTACFLKKKYQFSLWNKMFRADLCKEAVINTPDWYLPKAQDKLLYWAIALHAGSYRGMPEKSYYNYYFGRGGTGFNTLNLKQFKRYCTMADTANAMHTYLVHSGKATVYQASDTLNHTDLFNDCFARFRNEVMDDQKARAFDLMIQKWGSLETISALAKVEWFNRYPVAKYLRGAESLRPAKKEPKVIGTYYHSCENGGAQRVMCDLALLLDSMGYSLVIFTDEIPSANDFPLPDSAKRVILPHYQKTNRSNYSQRASVLEHALREYHVDIMLYHAWVLNMMLWDELVCKVNGVAFIGHCHNIFALPYLRPREAVQNFVAPYMLADAVVTLSKTDQYYWQHFNPNTHVTINPIPEEYLHWETTDALDQKQILWLGRLANEKRPYDLLTIMQQVVAEVPDAHLHIVGSNPSEKYMENFREKIHTMELDDYVTLHGFQMDVGAYYRQASLFLMTSQYEGYPLTLQESKLAGLPCVMYKMPYLTLCEGNRGIIAVEQQDKKAAAQAIVELLTDDEKRRQYAAEARSHIDELLSFDFAQKWQEIIDSIYQEHTDVMPDCAHIMLDTILEFQANSAKRAGPQVVKTGGFLGKLKGGIQCWIDHGLLYTIKLAFKKLFAKIFRGT